MTVLKQPRWINGQASVPVVGRKYRDSSGVVLRAVPAPTPGLCYGCAIYTDWQFSTCHNSGRPSCVERPIVWKKVKK